jgi:hypothetical protein
LRGKKHFVALAALVGVLVIGGLAVAYWTQGGTGSGAASTGTTSAITVNQTSTASGMYPGGPAIALSGTFDNPNPGAVHISSVTAVVHAFSSQLLDGSKPACTQADYAIGGLGTGAIVVPSGAGVGSWSGLTVRMLDGAGNQDNCKGVSITIDYTANP